MTKTRKVPTESKELNGELLRKRALELIDIDYSWRAFFLGKANARRHAGFTAEELNAIDMQNSLDKLAYQERRTKETDYLPYLRRKSKELEHVDSSWKLICLCFEKENVRLQSGFTHQELADISIQRERDYKNKLVNPQYLRARGNERDKVDTSWTALFRGRDHARTKAGFQWRENNAIDIQKKIDAETRLADIHAKIRKKNTSSFFSWLFGKKDIEDNEKSIRLETMKERQAQRKDDLAFRKQLGK